MLNPEDKSKSRKHQNSEHSQKDILVALQNALEKPI